MSAKAHKAEVAEIVARALLAQMREDLSSAGPASRSFFQGLVQGEIIALGLLLDFAAALGLDEGDLEAYEPRPGGQAFPAYVVSLASYGSAADVGAAFLVNFAVFGENTGRMSAALRSQYGFQAEDVAFFDFFANATPSSAVSRPPRIRC